MNLEFRRLSEVPFGDIAELFNHPAAREHLPLATGEFTANTSARFVAGKEQIWTEHGYGPWAFFVDGLFAGWGGLQPKERTQTWGSSSTRDTGVLDHA